MAIKPSQGWYHDILGSDEGARNVRGWEDNILQATLEEEARIVLLIIKWIVALPGTLLEVGNC